MNTLRVRPGRELTRLLDVFGPAWGGGWLAAPSDGCWQPRVDVTETEESLTVRYELAGFDPDGLEATLEDHVLTVKGERSFAADEGASYRRRELAQGSFTRSIRIPESYDADAIRASYSNGLLEITVGKRPETLPKTVEIERA